MERADCLPHLWNGSLGGVVTDTGNMVEWANYSSHGLPFGIPLGDTKAGATLQERVHYIAHGVGGVQ